MDIESAIRERYLNLEWALDERLRRLYAAAEAKAIGHGGVTLVWKATGVARGSIQQGLKELVQRPEAMESNSRRIRRIGAGRKPSVADDAELLSALESLVEPVTRGDPESPLRWTCKSLRQLESELVTQGYIVSHTSIGSLLKKLGYSLQGNRKTLEHRFSRSYNRHVEIIF
jgi:stage V sporulation protein SpoVS